MPSGLDKLLDVISTFFRIFKGLPAFPSAVGRVPSTNGCVRIQVQQRAQDPGDLLRSLKTLQEWYRVIQRARRESRVQRERRD